MKTYWPSAEHIQSCIRTEAEELDADVLLAVHEPMCLQRSSDNETVMCSEQEVLASLYASERPIPIIGRSGVGKSHLIRWLDAKLRQDPNTATWHIVRIPKNASLRQVLELLLAGVEGDVFDQARAKVIAVTETLKTDELAKLLLTFMEYYLTARGKQIVQQAKANLISVEQQKKLKLILSQLNQPHNLQALIGDSVFKTTLLAQQLPIYQCALRMTQGEAHEDELWHVIPPEIFDFSDRNLDDLSLHARQYVVMSRLSTDAEVRQTVAQLLGEALSDATQKVFGHLFQFEGVGFQDVFRHIRQVLLSQGKTLCILIEDMAAISAIENILIDSLLEESIRDGKQQWCTLRSAIAVTDGYMGYTRRQDTLRTRAIYEWRILDRLTDEQTDDLELITRRVMNLYGRYVNAARWGQQLLKQQWLTAGGIAAWDDADVDEQTKAAFGYSDQNYNLYPLSHHALSTLVQKYCQREQQWYFNPRAVLNHIVLPTLRHQADQFPPEGWLGIEVRSDIGRELSRLGQPERSCTVAAIWGGQARQPAQLRASLSPVIAQAFGLDDLADWLQQSGATTSPSMQQALSKPISMPQAKALPKSRPASRVESEPTDPLESIEQHIEDWLDPQRSQKLSQNIARDLRNILANLYKAHAQPKDYGFGKLPELKSTKINIYAAYTGNDESNRVWFISQPEFESDQRRHNLKSVALMLLRHHHFNQQQIVDWNYPQGLEDYFVYQAFVASWVPAAVTTLQAMEKLEIHSAFGKQYLLARQLGLKPSPSLPMLADVLLLQEPLSNRDVLEALQPLYQSLCQQWQTQQQLWASRLMLIDHKSIRLWGLESVLAEQSKSTLRSEVIRTCRELYKRINTWSLYLLLQDVQSKEQFSHLINQFKDSIDQIMASGQFYPKLPNFHNNKTILKALDRLSAPTGWEHVQKLQFLYAYQTELPSDDQTLDKILSYFAQLQQAVVNDLNLMIEGWQGIYAHSLSPIEAQNKLQGSGQLQDLEQQCKNLLDQLHLQLQQCAQVIK